METSIGVERERFIVDLRTNMVVTSIDKLLPVVKRVSRSFHVSEDFFGYELFAGQIEDKTPPCITLQSLRESLTKNDVVLKDAAVEAGLGLDCSEIIKNERMPDLRVNPFDRHHKEEWESYSTEMRRDISSLAGVDVHLSVTEDQAVALINFCRKKIIGRLIEIGDHSNGKRMDRYRAIIQNDGIPPVFSDFNHLMLYIQGHNGEKNITDLVKYRPSIKTVEFKMFGATEKVDDVIEYAEVCLQLLQLS